jgi:hypothetical protein
MDAGSPVVSLGGRYLVCKMLEEHSGEWQVTVVDLPKLRIVKRFDRIPIDTPVQWYPDETALVYVKDEKGISNLWKTVINSGLEVPVTQFKEDKIVSFDWSPNAHDHAMVRGIASSDVLLIKPAR